MTDHKDTKPDLSELRRRAEEQVKQENLAPETFSKAEADRLIHELRVHQIELEMQNEELREAQVKLAEARDRYADLYEFAPVGYLTLDEWGRINEANLSAATFLKVERSRLLGKYFWLLVVEEERPAFQRLLANCLNLPQRQSEFHFQRGNNEVRPALLNSSFWQDEAGKKFCRLSLTDITEHERAEQALRKSEERFRALVTATMDAVYRMSPDWTEMRELKGRKFLADTKTPNQTWLEMYIFPEDQAHVLAVIHEAIRTRSVFELEHRIRRVDGSAGWTLSRAIPILDKNGEIIEWFGAAKDITTRKEAEAKLQESDATLQAIMEYLPEGLTIADAPDVNIRMVSRYGQELAGRPPEVIEGIPMEEHSEKWGIFHSDGITPGVNEELPMSRAVKRGEVTIDEEWAIKRPDGEIKTVLCNAGPIRDATGAIIGGLVAWRDITKRKEAEAYLRDSEQKLRHLTSRLLSIQEEERQRIARDLHDEMGQSLMALKMQLNAIKRSFRRGHESWEEFDQAVDFVDVIANQTRAICQSLRPVVLDDLGLNGALRQLLGEYQKHHGLEISEKLADLSGLFSHEAQITVYRIFQECLTNAIQHGKAAGVKVGAYMKNDAVCLICEDNGIGFDLGDVKSGNAASQGHGLAAMEERVRLLQGSFEITSAQGKGTRIEITLPVDKLLV